MKLLMVSRRFPPDVLSGTETVFENLWRRARQRHEVRLVVGYVRQRELVPPDAVGVDLRGAPQHLAWARLWTAATRELRRFRPDAVLANSIESPSIGAPTACIVHDLNFGRAERTAGTRAREVFYVLKSRWLKAIITVSDATKMRLLELGVPGEKIHVIRNGVDLDVFRPAAARHSRPGVEDPVHFAYPSRILPSKGQHLALDALARLPKPYKQRAQLTIAGASVDPIFVDQLKIQAFEQPVEIRTDVPQIAPVYSGTSRNPLGSPAPQQAAEPSRRITQTTFSPTSIRAYGPGGMGAKGRESTHDSSPSSRMAHRVYQSQSIPEKCPDSANTGLGSSSWPLPQQRIVLLLVSPQLKSKPEQRSTRGSEGGPVRPE